MVLSGWPLGWHLKDDIAVFPAQESAWGSSLSSLRRQSARQWMSALVSPARDTLWKPISRSLQFKIITALWSNGEECPSQFMRSLPSSCGWKVCCEMGKVIYDVIVKKGMTVLPFFSLSLSPHPSFILNSPGVLMTATIFNIFFCPFFTYSLWLRVKTGLYF